MKILRTSSTLLAFCSLSLLCYGGKASDITPVLTKPGKLVIEENFTGSSLDGSWTVAKGDWQIKDGAVAGKEKKSDNHPAVLQLKHPFQNSVIRFSFKLDGAKKLSLSLNHEKGHLFRIQFDKDSLVLLKDKDKSDPKSKQLNLAKANTKFEPGKWHTVLVEISGAAVSVQTDGGAKLKASNPELTVGKTGYRFVVQGESVLISDLKVWDVQN